PSEGAGRSFPPRAVPRRSRARRCRRPGSRPPFPNRARRRASRRFPRRRPEPPRWTMRGTARRPRRRASWRNPGHRRLRRRARRRPPTAPLRRDSPGRPGRWRRSSAPSAPGKDSSPASCVTSECGSPTAKAAGTGTRTAWSTAMPPTTEPDESVASPAAAESGEDRPGVRRILLVDDHPLVADGLRILVEALEPATTLLWTGTLEEGFDTLASERDIMLVLLDLRLPGYGGYSALDRFRQQYPDMPVAVLSGSTERALILGSLERGARGFIPKTANRDDTARALERVAAGEIYV